jgi:menaquinone-dependent protoporphyrinogen IX oxidase
MNKTAVIYQSTYGTTRTYAEQIAQELGADLIECKKIRISELIGYDTIIFGGGIYAGRIAGSGLLRKNYEKLSDKHLVVFSVGFTPQARADILDKVRNSSFEANQLKNIRFFHFRGGIDYKKLNLLHRILLSVKRLSIAMQLESKLTDDNKRFLKLYGKSVELTLDSPQVFITYVKGIHSL